MKLKEMGGAEGMQAEVNAFSRDVVALILEKLGGVLQLSPILLGSCCDDEMGKLDAQFFLQGDATKSRKQVEPLIRAVVTGTYEG